MKYRVEIVAESIQGGDQPCAMYEGGVRHGAKWHVLFRMHEGGEAILTGPTEKDAKHGFVCDAHLYPVLQKLHAEVQAGFNLRTALVTSSGGR